MKSKIYRKKQIKAVLLMELVFVFYGVVFSQQMQEMGLNSIFSSANELYSKKEYSSAREKYEEVRKLLFEKNKVSGEVLYNIGNCYYRENKLGYARYYYELAKLISCRDNDINYNLKFLIQLLNLKEEGSVVEKICDKFTLQEIYWILFVGNIIFFALFFASILIGNKLVRRLRNVSLLFFLVLVILFFIKYSIVNKNYGIVVEPTIISSSPDEDIEKKSSSVAEGRKVVVISEKDDYYSVYLTEENVQGWIKKDKVYLLKQ